MFKILLKTKVLYGLQSDTYIYTEDDHSTHIRKFEKLFEDQLDFGNIKVKVKLNDVHETGKSNFIGITAFAY